MDLLHIVELSIYLLGMFFFGTLVVHAFLPRLQGPAEYCSQTLGIEFAMMLTSFFWFSANLTDSILRSNPDINLLPLQVVLVFIQLLFPALIMQIVYSDVQRSEHPLRAGHWTPWYRGVYLASFCIFGWLVAVVFGNFPNAARWINLVLGIGSGLLFGISAIYSVLAMSVAAKHRKSESVEERSSRRSIMVLFGVMLAFVVVVFFVAGGEGGIGRFLRLFGSSMPLLFVTTTLYHENRFGFVDLAVKRGLAFMLTYGLLAAYFAWVFPRLSAFHGGGIGPWVLAISMLPLAVALPYVYLRLNAILDNRWLGRRFTTVDAVKEFLAAMQSATGEQELIEQAEHGLLRIFRAPTRIELSLTQAPPLDFNCVVDVPIVSGTERIGVVMMGRRENQVPYMSEDRTLLESLVEVFSYMLENVRLHSRKQEQEQQTQELSHQASLSELKALRAQINPHFLFNALNAIAGLIHKDPFRADHTVEQLAEVFRYTLRRSEKEWARLEDEFEFVSSYLEVEKSRFGDRLQISIELDDAIGNVQMPVMVVQTLVENAIKHGVASVRGTGRVEVRARRDSERVVIEVADNGAGPGTESARSRPKGEGFGLRSVRERLHGYFGDEALLTLTRDEPRGMTVARLSIPLDHGAAPRMDNSHPKSGSAGAASA